MIDLLTAATDRVGMPRQRMDTPQRVVCQAKRLLCATSYKGPGVNEYEEGGGARPEGRYDTRQLGGTQVDHLSLLAR